jgi:hypothetical protein
MLVPDLSAMVQNLSITVPELMRLVTAFGFVLGMYFVTHGVILLRNLPPYGHSNPPVTLKQCLVYMFVGAALIYLPTTVSVGTSTFFTETAPYAYIQNETSPYTVLYNAIFMIIKFIGAIAFIRGLILFTRAPSQQDSSPIARAATHCIGGIFCINMEVFIVIVCNTLGISFLS